MKTLSFLIVALFSISAFGHERQTVMYEIPAPDSLSPYSRFRIDYEVKEHGDGSTELRYRMPDDLLGQEQEFRFRGLVDPTAESFTLSSIDGEMKCQRHSSQTLCAVVHKNVKVDLVAVKAKLDVMPISAEEKIGRFELASLVARREGGDMVGILTYVPGIKY